LIQAGLISARELSRAVKEQRRSGERLGAVLVRLQLASDEQIASALASQLGLPYADLATDAIDPEAARLIPKAIATREGCLALRLDRQTLFVAMADPLRISLVQDLQDQTGYRIREVVAARGAILDAIERAYLVSSPGEAQRPETDDRRDADAELVSVDDLVDRILRQAIANEASDVHIDPGEDDVIIRFRIDGVLREWLRVPAGSRDDLVARFKILAGLDVAEKLLPQSGRVRLASSDGRIDMRAFTLRTAMGERVVLTVRGHARQVPPLDDLGLSDRALEDLRASLAEGGGLVVVAGGAGSGRSTTLAAALDASAAGRSAVTIEDGVDYEIPGISRTQVAELIGLTFANALRAILRQDPDVILLGDVPDQETARLAADAARAGKLVLCSLAAHDANAAMLRLSELGIDVASQPMVRCVVAQRLVRRLCTRCRVPYSPAEGVLRSLGLPPVDATLSFFKAAGCGECDYTGYRGRIGLFEVIRISDAMRRVVGSRPAAERAEAAFAAGVATVAEDGLAKAKSGVTSVEEVRRAVRELHAPRPVCAACGQLVAVEFLACPRCGERLGLECAHCGRALEPGWTFCPFCARKVEAPASNPRRGIIRLVRNSNPPDLV